MNATDRRSALQRWADRRGAAAWGTDPAHFEPAHVERAAITLRRLFGPGAPWPVEARGLGGLPPAPAMLVSNHGGGTTLIDVVGLVWAWYEQLGTGRPLHPIAHELAFASRPFGPFLSRAGALRAHPANAARVLAELKRDLLVYPGGDQDAWRPFTDRWKVEFAGRTGYARTALRLGVPVVPVAHAGAHHSFVVLRRGTRLARALGLHRVARSEIWPVHLSLPWGLALAPLPHLPVPVRMRYRAGAPIDVGAAREPTEREVHVLDAAVRRHVQRLLDELRMDG